MTYLVTSLIACNFRYETLIRVDYTRTKLFFYSFLVIVSSKLQINWLIDGGECNETKCKQTTGVDLLISRSKTVELQKHIAIHTNRRRFHSTSSVPLLSFIINHFPIQWNRGDATKMASSKDELSYLLIPIRKSGMVLAYFLIELLLPPLSPHFMIWCSSIISLSIFDRSSWYRHHTRVCAYAIFPRNILFWSVRSYARFT